jgi:hypothetical protein
MNLGDFTHSRPLARYLDQEPLRTKLLWAFMAVWLAAMVVPT